MACPRSLDFLPGFSLEGFPNRDSTQYSELYGLGSQVQTLLRGTIRYKGKNILNNSFIKLYLFH